MVSPSTTHHSRGNVFIQEHIDAGITLADAINFLVEKYELVRIDRRGFSWQNKRHISRLLIS